MDEKPSDNWRRLGRAAIIALWAVREIFRTAWRMIRGPILFALQVLAALIVLFEEWGWKPLSDALAWLARFAPIARLERWIAGLGPYPSLFVFALPTTFLAPLKLLAVWLLATGKYWTATSLFIAAKVAATALVARLFTLTKPSLMQIQWFARLYQWFMPWKDAFFAVIRTSWPWRYGRMIKNLMRRWLRRFTAKLRPRLSAFIAQNDFLRRLTARLPARLRHVLTASEKFPPSEQPPMPLPPGGEH